MAQTSALHREWARRGALARLEEIDTEKSAIFASFPELKRGIGKLGSASVGGPRKRRKKMSAAARRRMAAGMRRYWARRKAEGK
jgi:hypothetical protein